MYWPRSARCRPMGKQPTLIPDPPAPAVTVRFTPARIARLRHVAAVAGLALGQFIQAAAIARCDAVERAAGRVAAKGK